MSCRLTYGSREGFRDWFHKLKKLFTIPRKRRRIVTVREPVGRILGFEVSYTFLLLEHRKKTVEGKPLKVKGFWKF